MDDLYVRPARGRVVVGREVHPDDEGYSHRARRMRNPFAAYGRRDLRMEVSLADAAGNLVTSIEETIDAVGPRATFGIAGSSETLSEVPRTVHVRVLEVHRHPHRRPSPVVSNVRIIPDVTGDSSSVHVRAELAEAAAEVVAAADFDRG